MTPWAVLVFCALLAWPQTPTGKSTARTGKTGSASVTSTGTASSTTKATGSSKGGGKKPHPVAVPSTPVLSLSLTGSRVDLTWTASTDAAGVTGYQLQRCAGVNCTGFALLASLAETSYRDNGDAHLSGGSYTYRVRAVDAANQVSAFAVASTVLPHWVLLSWTASTTAGVSGYRVYRRIFPGGSYGEPLNAELAAGVSYSDHSAIAAGVSYAYVVTAVHPTLGESAHSNEVTGTIPRP